MLNQDSLARFLALAQSDPRTQRQVERSLVDSYHAFIDVLYKDLDEIIQKTQDRKQIYCSAGEDVITMHIVDLLDERGYDATHDPKIGGHVDIVVRHRNDRSYMWLGEAKLDNGATWIEKGMQQLCRRYSDGSHNRGHGGILVYCQGKKAAMILQRWRDELAKSTAFESLAISDCERTPRLAFNSTHVHDTSGLPYTVRHMAIALYHEPTV